MTTAADLTTEQRHLPGRRRHGKASRLYTATELSITLDWSRRMFWRFRPIPAARVTKSYGRVPVFDPVKLPRVVKSALQAARAASGCRSNEELVRLRLQANRRNWLKLAMEQRLAPSPTVFVRQGALARYFCLLDRGQSETKANHAARAELVRAGAALISDRQIRRLAARIDACGGPELAPIDVYGQLRSVPHLRARKWPHHGASARGAGACHSTKRKAAEAPPEGWNDGA